MRACPRPPPPPPLALSLCPLVCLPPPGLLAPACSDLTSLCVCLVGLFHTPLCCTCARRYKTPVQLPRASLSDLLPRVRRRRPCCYSPGGRRLTRGSAPCMLHSQAGAGRNTAVSFAARGARVYACVRGRRGGLLAWVSVCMPQRARAAECACPCWCACVLVREGLLHTACHVILPPRHLQATVAPCCHLQATSAEQAGCFCTPSQHLCMRPAVPCVVHALGIASTLLGRNTFCVMRRTVA